MQYQKLESRFNILAIMPISPGSKCANRILKACV